MEWLKRLRITDDTDNEDAVDVAESKDEASNKMINILPWLEGEVPIPPHNFVEPTYLDVNIETIHKMHVKPLAIRNFICGKVFRRDEIVDHLINVHQEIIPGLSSGWFLSRCPLAYSGCSYASENMAPNSEKFRLLWQDL